MSNGTRANKRGKYLQLSVANLLLEGDYEEVEARRFFAMLYMDQPIFAQECPIGKDIYGKNRRVDIILYHPLRWKECLVIQCKWQASRGSIEEKYPFEVLSIQLNEFQTIIVMDGGGYSKGAENWLKAQAGKKKLLHVMNLGEFQRFQTQGRI